MLYVDDDGGPIVVVRDDVSSDTIYVWLGNRSRSERDQWLRSARNILINEQYWARQFEMDQPLRLAEIALFRAGLHTPDCGDALTVPQGAQAWLRFFCRWAEDAQEALEDREWARSQLARCAI